MGLFDWFKRSPDNNTDTLGSLVSHFVLERANKPHLQEVDLLSDATCAYLFSVAWEVVFCTSNSLKSADSLQSEIDTIIADTANHAQYWISEYLQDAFKHKHGTQIKVDIGPDTIRDRMTSHFNIALEAFDERGYSLPLARSHSCWTILTRCSEKLVTDGANDQRKAAKDVAKYTTQAFEKCESLAAEFTELIHQRKQSE